MNRAEALRKLDKRLEDEFNHEIKNGLIDCKSICEFGRDMSSHAYAWTLANAMRQVREGKVKPIPIEGIDDYIQNSSNA